MSVQPYFLHVDLDAFFASVEQLDFPQYRGKPVIVGGKPSERRTVVSTCSYEARKFGVHSAMPIQKAYQLCPHAIFLHGRMSRYHEKSREVMHIFSEFSPDVQQMSIDEAFIDISGTERLFGKPEETALLLKKRVQQETGLSVSVGLATNKYIAKIASGRSKPNGFFSVPIGDEEDFMLSLKIADIWGIGSKMAERLHSAGLLSVKDIHSKSESLLRSLFGEHSGKFLYNVVRGKEQGLFNDDAKTHSISSERTYEFDLSDAYIIETALLSLVHDVFFRMLDEQSLSRTVHIRIRYEDFTTVRIQETFSRCIDTAEELFECAKKLFHRKWEKGRGIRLLGLGFAHIESIHTAQQKELFDFGYEKKRAVQKAIYELQKKNKYTVIKKARLLKETNQ